MNSDGSRCGAKTMSGTGELSVKRAPGRREPCGRAIKQAAGSLAFDPMPGGCEKVTVSDVTACSQIPTSRSGATGQPALCERKLALQGPPL